MAIRPPDSLPPAPIAQRNNYVRPPMAPPRTSYVPTTMLPGFFVNSDSEISSADVPTDGSISFFPYRDLARIVIKQWSGGPTLETATYVLQQTQSSQDQSMEQTQALPPPPPVQRNQTNQNPAQNESSAILATLNQLNENSANAFNLLGGTLQAIQTNLERLNDRFVDDGGCG